MKRKKVYTGNLDENRARGGGGGERGDNADSL